jgi:hypothetical protein
MKRLNVDLPNDLHREIKLAAMYDDVTISFLVIQLIHAHLTEQASSSPHPLRRATDRKPFVKAFARVEAPRASGSLIERIKPAAAGSAL